MTSKQLYKSLRELAKHLQGEVSLSKDAIVIENNHYSSSGVILPKDIYWQIAYQAIHDANITIDMANNIFNNNISKSKKCQFTNQLKKIRQHFLDISKEYGSFIIDIRISVYGQSVMYHLSAISTHITNLTYEVVSNNLEGLEINFKNQLSNHANNSEDKIIFELLFPKT